MSSQASKLRASKEEEELPSAPEAMPESSLLRPLRELLALAAESAAAAAAAAVESAAAGREEEEEEEELLP